MSIGMRHLRCPEFKPRVRLERCFADVDRDATPLLCSRAVDAFHRHFCFLLLCRGHERSCSRCIIGTVVLRICAPVSAAIAATAVATATAATADTRDVLANASTAASAAIAATG